MLVKGPYIVLKMLHGEPRYHCCALYEIVKRLENRAISYGETGLWEI